jgi:hypothetical protein
MFKSTILGDFSTGSYKGGNCIAVLDTETTGLPPLGMVYDVGYSLVEIQHGCAVIVYKGGVLIDEIFSDSKVMRNAYFANKVFTHYPYLLQAGVERLKPFSLASIELRSIFNSFNVDKIAAYNANFDKRMLAATATALQCGNVFESYEWIDLWQVSCNTFLQDMQFIKWANARGFISGKGNVMTSAEVVNKYLTGNDFAEDHTALSDSVLEAGILAHIIKLGHGGLLNASSMTGKTWQAVNSHAAKDWVKAHPHAPQPTTETRY